MVILLTGLAAYAEKESEDRTLIVRFAGEVTQVQASAKLDAAGAHVVEVLSAERNTYEAKTPSKQECEEAIAALRKDPQVIFAEHEHSYSTDKNAGKRAPHVVPNPDPPLFSLLRIQVPTNSPTTRNASIHKDTPLPCHGSRDFPVAFCKVSRR